MEYSVTNFLTGEKGRLYPVDSDFICTENDVRKVMDIFNSNEVFSWLFTTRRTTLFTIEATQQYITWLTVKSGENSINAYFLRGEDGAIHGGLDLQRVSDTIATLGYWADPLKPGFITNAVKQVLDIALDLGYKVIDAYPENGNEKSLRVLERTGFSYKGNITKGSRILLKYVINLPDGA